MDVLQEIFRSNGRSVNLLQHNKVSVGVERGLYYLRGEHVTGTREVVTIYLTEAEVDRLIKLRQRTREIAYLPGLPQSINDALRGFSELCKPRSKK